MKIKTNKIQCNNCKDIIESKYTHDFVQCSCKRCFVDGGKEYLRRGYTTSEADYTDLSETEEDK